LDTGLGIEIDQPAAKMAIPIAHPLKTPLNGKTEAFQSIVDSQPQVLQAPPRVR
jgi:hypothetical protein